MWLYTIQWICGLINWAVPHVQVGGQTTDTNSIYVSQEPSSVHRDKSPQIINLYKIKVILKT